MHEYVDVGVYVSLHVMPARVNKPVGKVITMLPSLKDKLSSMMAKLYAELAFIVVGYIETVNV